MKNIETLYEPELAKYLNDRHRRFEIEESIRKLRKARDAMAREAIKKPYAPRGTKEKTPEAA